MNPTKEEALIFTANLWNLIYHREYEDKWEALKCLIADYEFRDINNDCPCCEYVESIIGILSVSGCTFNCPMYGFFVEKISIANEIKGLCEHVGSPYTRWVYVGGGKHGKPAALDMRNGALECLEKLWEES